MSPDCVVKLGSTLVADERGDVRADVLREVCRQVGDDPRRRRSRPRSSPRARSRSACARWACPCARRRSRSCRPPPRSGRGRCTTSTPDLLGGARRGGRPGAADLLRHLRARAVPERAPHAREAARLGRRAGHQRERHDRHRRDQLRRQRHPRRAGRDPAVAPTCWWCSPTWTALFTSDPRRDPDAALVDGGARPGRAAATTRSACRARTSARAGCAARCCAPRWRRRRASRS